MTPAAKAISVTLATTAVLIMLHNLILCSLSPFQRSVTCEKIYKREVMLIDKALKECALADRPFPTLDELVALKLYTLPQDRQESTSGYPIDPRDLRVKLYSIYHPHIAYARRVIVTSTKDKCKNGNTLVVSSHQGPKVLWFESRLTH